MNRDPIALLILLGFFVLGFIWGMYTRESVVLARYCESQSAQYEVVDGVDYCLKDNQLTQIEWMK